MSAFLEILLYVFLFAGLYFQVFLLIVFFERKGELSSPRQTPLESFPAVSIIIPCFNEERTLSKTVQSILALDYPSDKISVFIVDDGSTDSTLSIAKQYELDPRFSIFHKENGGKHTALNLALEYVTTDFVGCLDADSYVDPNALTEIMRHFEDPETMTVTPAIRIDNPTSVFQYIQKAEYNMSVFLRKIFAFLDAVQVTPGPFSIFRTQVFADLGTYRHAHKTEDMEIALRMHTAQYKITNAERAFVYTTGPRSFRALYKQRLRWTYGFLMNVVDYRRLLFNKHYGNIGILVLPGALVSITGALYFTSYFLYTAVEKLAEIISKYSAIGISWNISLPKVDWFYINTEMAAFLSVLLFSSSILIALLGKKMAEGNVRPSLDIVYFVFLYGFLAPIWLARAVYNAILSKESAWR